MISSRNYQTATNGDSIHTVLSLSVLSDLDRKGIEGLSKLGITTVGQLLNYQPFHVAELLMAIANRKIGHEISLENFLLSSFLNVSYEEIPKLEITALKGLGEVSAVIFEEYFQISNILELSSFKPYEEAQRYLELSFSEPPSAPKELLPGIMGNVSSSVRYNTYAKGKKIRYSDYGFSLGINPHRCSNNYDTIFKGSSSEIQGMFEEIVKEYNLGNPSGFFNGESQVNARFTNPLSQIFVEECELYFGYLLSHHQRWINSGTQLGEIINSLSLAPGESRNVAIIEWYRRQSSNRNEDTKTDERLNENINHLRALNEVTEATAREHLTGETKTKGNASTLGFGASSGAGSGAASGGSGSGQGGTGGMGFGGSGAGLMSGAGMMGFSGMYGSSKQQGEIHAETTGEKELMVEAQQNISQSTQQNASRIRSLWSTVVITDEQLENEQVNTKNITNYNHSHALTIQYYEVLQKYKVKNEIRDIRPLLFLPFQPENFTIEKIKIYWDYLAPIVANEDSNLFLRIEKYFVKQQEIDLDFDVNSQIYIDSIDYTYTYKWAYNSRSYIKIGEFTSSNGFGEYADNITPFAQNDFKEDINKTGILKGYVETFGGSHRVRIEDVKHLYLDGRDELRDTISGLHHKQIDDSNDVYLNVDLMVTLEDESGSVERISFKRSFGKADLESKARNRSNIGQHYGKIGDRGSNEPYRRFIVIDDLGGQIKNEVIDRRNPVDMDKLDNLVSEIEMSFNRRKYFFTRSLLMSLEPELLVDVFKTITFSFNNEECFKLSDLVDLPPIGIAQDTVLFELKDSTLTGIDEIDSSFSPCWLLPLGLKKLCDKLKSEETIPGPQIDEIFLPTPGVFAEAILGRSNASEFVDPRRFWNWQDSPIPNKAPQILPITIGSRNAAPPGELDPNVPESTLSQAQPPSFPDAVGLAAALQAIQNGNMFRDMSKSGELTNTLTNLSNLANNAAITAGKLSEQAAEAALNGAIELGKQVAGMVNQAAGSGMGSAPTNLTEKAAALNELDKIKKNIPSGIVGGIDDLDKSKGKILGTNIENKNQNKESKPTIKDSIADKLSHKVATAKKTKYSDGNESIEIVEGTDENIIAENGIETIVVTYRTFIPSPAIIAPSPSGIRAFGGDNRTFSLNRGSHRSMIRFLLKFDGDSRYILEQWEGTTIEFGQTKEYNHLHTTEVVGKPTWYRNLRTGANPKATKKLERTTDNLKYWYETGSNNIDIIRLRVNGANPLMEIAPKINSELRIQLQRTNDITNYSIYGSHDGFPCHEIYLNQEKVYSFNPLYRDHGPESLAPPLDIPVHISTRRLISRSYSD